MKKIISVLLSLLCLIALNACGGTASKDKSLYTAGNELADLLASMATNEDYIALYFSDGEMTEYLDTLSVKNSAPKAVYELTAGDEVLAMLAETFSADSLPPELKNYVESRAFSSLGTMINARGGANMLAASSMCTASKSFVNSSFKGSTMYIYTYEEGFPMFVSFVSGDDGAVSATATYILYDGFDAADAESIAASFDEIPVSVTLVKE